MEIESIQTKWWKILTTSFLPCTTWDWQQSIMLWVWKDEKWRQNFRTRKVTFKQSGWIPKKRLPQSSGSCQHTSPTLLTASSGLGKPEPLTSSGTRHLQKTHPLEAGAILVAFTLAGMQEHHTEADVGLFCHALKLLKPTAILYQQQCQLLWQAARLPRAPHFQPDQADANKTACTASCPQVRRALPLLQDGAAVCLTTNSFTFPLHFYFSFGVGENTPHPSPETTALFTIAMGWVSI